MAKLYFKVGSDWEEVVRLRDEIVKLKQELKGMDNNQTPVAFNTLNTQLTASTRQLDGLIVKAAQAGVVMEGDFKKKIFDASQGVNGFTEKIIAQKAKVKDVEADVKRLGDAYRSALKNSPLSANNKLSEYKSAKKSLDEEKAALFGLTQEQANARLSVKKLRDEYALYKNDAKDVVDTNNGIAISWKKALAVIGGVAVLKQLGSEIIRVRGEFQSMQTSIETLVGKDVAGRIIPQIKEMAKVSPLTLTDFVGAEKMMLGFNIEADKTIGFLRSLSDISMGDSQKFNSLTLAFSQMSSTGKLMGQDLNQMINAGFNPLQTISEKTGKSIATLKDEMSKGAISAEMVQQAFIDATSAGGKFFGMSENASKEINGQISMMQDAMDAAFNEMGQKSEGFIMSAIQGTTSLIENYETVGKVLAGLVITYGVYRTAVMLVTAAESKHTLVEIGLTNVRVLARKAQLALNAAMLTNPYVLLAVAVTGLGATMWALHDSSTAAEKAQRKLNEEQKKFNDKQEERRQKIDKLIQVIKDETETEYAKIRAYEELQKYSPVLTAAYKREELAVASLTETNKKLNEERDKLDYNNIVSNIDRVKKSIFGLRATNGLVLGVSSTGIAKTINNDKEIKQAESDLKTWIGALDEYIRRKKELEENSKPIDVKLEVAKTDLAKIKKEFDDVKKELETEQVKFPWIIPFALQARFDTTRDSLKKQESKITGLEKEKAGIKTYSEDLKIAKKEWEKAKKELEKIEKDKKNFTTKQYKESKKNKESKEKIYKDLGGVVDVVKSAKWKESIGRNTKDQIRAEEDSINAVEQARIDAMLDSNAKTIALRQLNHKKEIQAIHREAEDRKQKAIDVARSEFSSNPANIKTEFDTDAYVKSEKAKKIFSSIDKESAAKIGSANIRFDRGDDIKNLINEYKDYAAQRLVIEEKFNNDIAVLRYQRLVAEKNNDTTQTQQLDRAIAQATRDKGKSLMQYDFGILKQSPEYVQAFEDLRNTSSETLNSLLKQLENAKEIASGVLNPADLREYTSTIQSIMDELDERNPFQTLVEKQQELADAGKELLEAKKQLDAVNSGMKVVTSVKIVTRDDGTLKLEEACISSAEALDKYRKAKDKAVKANNNFLKAEKTATDKLKDLSSVLNDVGNSIGGTTGEIISFMGDITSFVSTSIDGMIKIAQTGEQTLSAVEKASVILGIISAAVQLISKLESLTKSGYEKYEAYAEKLKEINTLTEAVNNYKISVLEAQQAENNWFSSDSLRNLGDLNEIHGEVKDAYDSKIREQQAVYQNKKGGSSWIRRVGGTLLGGLVWDNLLGTNLLGGKGNYGKGQTNAIDNLRIETRSAKKGSLLKKGRSQKTEDLRDWARNNGFGELFDKDSMINKDAAESILNQYGEKLVGQTKETLESLLKLREQYDEYINQLREYVNSIYEPLVDNFVDSIWDWLDTGKDALDSFKDYASETFRGIASDMLKTIVLKNIFGEGDNNYQNKIAKLYEEYASDNNMDKLIKGITSETDDLMKKAENQLPAIQNTMNVISDAFSKIGIYLSSSSLSSQSATKKGYETMSQDEGRELTGRVTDLQMTNHDIKDQNAIQTEKISLLAMKADILIYINNNTRDIACETLTIIANSYLELKQISENTGAIITPIKEMNDKLDKIQKNTENL